jgi:hypothetical protein
MLPLINMTRRSLGINLGGHAKIGGIFGERKFEECFLKKEYFVFY